MSYVGSQGHFLIADASNARGFYANQLDPQYLEPIPGFQGGFGETRLGSSRWTHGWPPILGPSESSTFYCTTLRLPRNRHDEESAAPVDHHGDTSLSLACTELAQTVPACPGLVSDGEVGVASVGEAFRDPAGTSP